MTYAGFLLIFLLPPAALLPWAYWRRREGPRRSLLLPPAVSIIALLYTTPWDNYLVANRIWWYDPDRISGIVLGWVPLEEYLFFLLQPIVTGFWTLWMLRRESARLTVGPGFRWRAVLPLGLLWGISLAALIAGSDSTRYLTLILVWALPPLGLQLAYGASLLWQLRGAAVRSILWPTLYLAAADSLAIAEGVWTISPQRSTGWLLPGGLPVEEFLFFLLTNTLIAFSVLLIGPRITPKEA